MPEQLAFQQIFWDSCGVYRHKWTIGPCRVFMQCLGNQLFARAGFTRNHDRHIALAQTANRAKHILHGWRLTQHFRRCSHALFGNFFTQAFFDSAAYQFHRLGQVKRLGQVFKSTPLKGRHGTVEIRKSRHDDDG